MNTAATLHPTHPVRAAHPPARRRVATPHRILRAELALLPLIDPPRHPPPPEERPRGCGWFDSSHELQRGLLVVEHADPAAAARLLPLEAWLDGFLGAVT